VKTSRDGVVSDEDLAHLRALSGTTHPVAQTNEIATKDAIRHFADGIGDPNPLWRDEHYATNTQYGCLIAPPTFLYAIVSPQSGIVESVPGLVRYDAGCDWEWFRTIKVKDVFTATNTFEDLVVKRAEPIGQRLFLQSGKMMYLNQRREIVGICRWSVIRSERSSARKEFGSEELDKLRYRYANEELAGIDRGYAEEELRGSNPRYWDDVEIGEVIRPVVKGPLTHADMVAFVVGTGIMGQAHSLSPVRSGRLSFWQDPETGVREPGDGIHFVDKVARGVASIPFAINMGIQRVCWLGHMMTNWMGDEGFLKGLSAQFRKPSYLGDTTWCRGKVTNKYVKDGLNLVKCEVWCENQKHEINTKGGATVILPARSH
jgi:acyl dehydratase